MRCPRLKIVFSPVGEVLDFFWEGEKEIHRFDMMGVGCGVRREERFSCHCLLL